ncbi:hypothetical protein CONPUDRAFT_163593 [Coniophora puteana RWD-64-598 SS2]|uniref:Uncharacterized protein n=1 Tax=Coniophora puteana (strain RWD-64-598) TaxID=741705 RepID=A0A5M3N0N2_CONPW|nr:uncharacterized protein CONPUDRAFT_163593 [Coniophora puteana RWD-64-598 SS2]EIW84465.1 hypothetical protein CONPUDRAFT_163593 [Coniophora puteana RWD-64-598 SS2]
MYSLRSPAQPCTLCPSTTTAVAFATATIPFVPTGVCMMIDTIPLLCAIIYCTPNAPLPAAAPPPAPAAPAPALALAPVSTTPQTRASLATFNSKKWGPGRPVVAQESRAMSEAVSATSSSLVPSSGT